MALAFLYTFRILTTERSIEFEHTLFDLINQPRFISFAHAQVQITFTRIVIIEFHDEFVGITVKIYHAFIVLFKITEGSHFILSYIDQIWMGCLYDLFSFYIQNSRNAQ